MAKKFFVSVCIFVLFPVFLFCACVAPGISGSGTHGADCTCEQCKPGGDAHGADCTCEECKPGDNRHPAGCTCAECTPDASHGPDCDCAECKGEEEYEMPEEWAIEFGFTQNQGRIGNTVVCAYKAEKIEFDIDNVVIWLFYGATKNTTGSAKLEFMQKNGSKTPIKEISDFYGNDDYAVDIIYTGNDYPNGLNLEFAHVERLIIPRMLFTEANGQISINVIGYPADRGAAPDDYIFNDFFSQFLNVYYLSDDEMVTISSTPFPTALESGFRRVLNGIATMQSDAWRRVCAYRSNQTEFDIDNVTIEFFYGFAFNKAFIRLYSSEGQEVLIKEIDEFSYYDYAHNVWYDVEISGDRSICHFSYKRSEIIRIPREFFQGEIGGIMIDIPGSVGTAMRYQVNGERVTLSVPYAFL